MRTVSIFMLAMILSGCQLSQIKEELVNPVTPPDCVISAERLSGLLMQERTYLVTTPQRRKTMLQQAQNAEDHPQHALLLSQPGASRAALKKAQQFYRKQSVRPSLECPGDRYLVLRQRQTDLQLQQHKRLFSLEKENRALRKQIEQLTQIEREISEDREINQ